MISFDEFKKVELRVGKVLTAERVEGSDKLLKLSVDMGSEKRQIVSGIGKYYEPEALVDTFVTIVTNLEPRMLMGLESQGMILASGGHEGVTLSLIRPDKDMPTGSSIS
ncbi:MAG: methionine--tRNA ligase subunit beta [Patescibacteria group bacterium]